MRRARTYHCLLMSHFFTNIVNRLDMGRFAPLHFPLHGTAAGSENTTRSTETDIPK